MSQQPLSGLSVYQVIGHQVLQTLLIRFGGNLQGTDQVITSQGVEVAGGWLMERSLR
jgi:hypothetical protein